jgi:hypothetical protein
VSYLLDTNVLSELRKGPRGHPHVAAWFAPVPDHAIYLSPRGVFLKIPIAAQPHDYRPPRGDHHENPNQEHGSGALHVYLPSYGRSQTYISNP